MYIARVPTRPSSPPAPVPPPPYGVVAVPAFRFRALAALAARTPLDEGREKLHAASQSHVVGVTSLLQERFDDEELEQFAELLARLDGDESPVDADCSA